MVDVISISGGKPTMLFPLSIILVLSMVKDIYEDCKRHRQDKKENYQKVEKYNVSTKEFEETIWKELLVGDIIKLVSDKFFPADLLLLNSSEPNGSCFVETKDLDGESNMKVKTCNIVLQKLL